MFSTRVARLVLALRSAATAVARASSRYCPASIANGPDSRGAAGSALVGGVAAGCAPPAPVGCGAVAAPPAVAALPPAPVPPAPVVAPALAALPPAAAL